MSAARSARSAVAAALAGGGSQNFLGARWVPAVVAHSPARWQRPVALRLLSLSPHYFSSSDLAAEAARNAASRRRLVADVLGPSLSPSLTVLDYGCGPGYLAAAVAPRVSRVYALDISAGVLACARVLNGSPSIAYLPPASFAASPVPVDLAYSFAVAQHLTDSVLASVLSSLYGWLRPGGRLVLHVVVDAPGWRPESAWRAERGVLGRARLRYGLHCFTRTAADLTGMAADAGFTAVRLRPAAELTAVDDDITDQHLLTAIRP